MRIAISGLSGCGNTTACRNVSDALRLPVINYTFRDLAAELGVPMGAVQAAAKTDARWDYYLDDRIIRQAERLKGWVIGTRLAAWRHDADLRVFLRASLLTRAKRIHKREAHKSLSHVLRETKKRDAKNNARYRKYYGVDMDDLTGMDLVVNTEQLTPKQVSALLVAAAKWAKANKTRSPNPWSARIRKTARSKLHGATLQQLKKTLT